MKRPLTAIAISKLTKPGRYAVGHGVYLQITGNRGRSWIFRFEREYGGKRRGRHIGLGPCPLVSLAEAREKGLEFRKLLLNGMDPLDHKKALRRQALEAAAKNVTFRECAERYIAAHEAAWGNAVHRRQWCATLDAHVHPVIGKLPVASVDTGLVVNILEPIWTSRPQTASRVRGRIESILDWAKVRGHRAGRILPGGEAISIICYLPIAGLRASNTTRHCPSRTCRRSCLNCASEKEIRRGLWNLPS